jgi:hypothetical protein
MASLKQASLVRDALQVKASHGKGLLRQALDVLRIKRRNPTLGATDYFAYRLYDSEFIGSSRPEDFLGWRAQEDLGRALNLRTLVLPAWDKASFAVVAGAYDLPIPALRAFYRPGPMQFDSFGGVGLNTPKQLAEWLRTQGDWPLFAKPSYSQKGLGCHRLAGYESSTDSLLTTDGGRLTVDHFVTSIVEHPSGPYYRREMGYLFQEALEPHRSIADLLGNQVISGVRVVVIQDENGPEVATAVWKIAAGNHDTDNWRRGTDGNIIAAIDLRDGRLQGAVEGIWPNARFLTKSPTTGRSFENFHVPDFERILGLCTRAATIFPLLRIQFWDIAPTDRGPVILELNDLGGIGSLQLHGKGILTRKMRALLCEYGDPSTFSWIEREGG